MAEDAGIGCHRGRASAGFLLAAPEPSEKTDNPGATMAPRTTSPTTAQLSALWPRMPAEKSGESFYYKAIHRHRLEQLIEAKGRKLPFCWSCGKGVSSDFQRCPFCGKNLNRSAVEPRPSQSPDSEQCPKRKLLMEERTKHHGLWFRFDVVVATTAVMSVLFGHLVFTTAGVILGQDGRLSSRCLLLHDLIESEHAACCGPGSMSNPMCSRNDRRPNISLQRHMSPL